MEPELIQGNIVLVAPDHRPEVVSKEWLNQKGILNEAAINFVHHQNFSLVDTTNFSINVVQQRVTITARNLDGEMLKRLQGITRRYVRALPNVSYNGIGLNSTWYIPQTDPNFLKSKFVTDKARFDEHFRGEANYNIGGIVYYGYNQFRVQLTVTPQNERIHADFNYHLDINNFDQLSEVISHFVETTGHARNTAKSLLGG